jgi:hypothetical protein
LWLKRHTWNQVLLSKNLFPPNTFAFVSTDAFRTGLSDAERRSSLRRYVGASSSSRASVAAVSWFESELISRHIVLKINFENDPG